MASILLFEFVYMLEKL